MHSLTWPKSIATSRDAKTRESQILLFQGLSVADDLDSFVRPRTVRNYLATKSHVRLESQPRLLIIMITRMFITLKMT